MRVKYRHFNCTAPLSQLKSNEVAKIRSGSGSEERGKQGGGEGEGDREKGRDGKDQLKYVKLSGGGEGAKYERRVPSRR
jgi:hypothetical protein